MIEWDKNLDKISKEGTTHPVGQKKPNPWGLYDICGNVLEWVQDSYHSNYDGAPSDGSPWESGNSSDRIPRGGGWFYNSQYCRSAARRWYAPGNRNDNVGFRLLSSPSCQKPQCLRMLRPCVDGDQTASPAPVFAGRR